MKQRNFKPRNVYHETKGRFFTQPSQTVPNMALSIKELMKRSRQGLSLHGQVPQYYGEDSLGIDIRKLDMTEKEELINGYKSELSELKKKISTNPLDKLVRNDTNNVIQNQNTTHNEDAELDA